MTLPILLATDLDRTLLPNGAAGESPRARPLFTEVARREEIVLAYVTGRHRALVEEAIARWQLPMPNIVIGDVGSSIYDVSADRWRPWDSWQDELAADWPDNVRAWLQSLLEAEPGLRLQDESRQSRFKISAFAPVSEGPWLQAVRQRVSTGGHTRLIFSIDEAESVGLVDALPQRAGKLGALEFVRRRLGIDPARTVFAGDSGNDLEVLTSGIPSVLVANAAAPMKERAAQEAKARGHSQALYVARGGFCGMNGNYAAGVLEGLAHHLPETRAWIA